MAPDSTTSKIEPIPLSPETPPRSKFRLRFRKAGDLRLVSHHDLMHVVERMFRRADIQLAVTQGFHPRPKMAFALSLALGVAGLNEVLEFETAEPLTADEVQRRFAWQCPPGLEIFSVRAIDPKRSAGVRRAWYRIATGPSRGEELNVRLKKFLAHSACWTERKRPQPRRINVRPFVSELHYQDEHLSMALWITPTGAARPEEVLAALGVSDLLDAGAVIERTDLELCDETPPGAPGAPLIQNAFEEITTNATETPKESRPTAIFDSPMSFET